MKDAIARYIGDELMSGRLPDGVSEHDDLLAGGLLDSLGVMQLVWFIEQEFDVDVPPEDVTIQNFQSIGRIVRYLEGRAPGT